MYFPKDTQKIISPPLANVSWVPGTVLGETGHNHGACPHQASIAGSGGEAINRHINVISTNCDSLDSQPEGPLDLKALEKDPVLQYLLY